MENFLYSLPVWFSAFGGMALVVWGASWLKNKIAATKMNNTAKGMLMRLNDAALRAVQSVNDAFVNELKDKKEFAEADKERAKKMAMDAMKAYMGPKGLNEAMNVLGFNEKSLDEKIEEAVEKEKVK